MKAADAERALRTLGFQFDAQKGSHQQWRKEEEGRLFKVTLAPHRGEVKERDVRSIIGQAGVTKEQWFTAAAGYLVE